MPNPSAKESATKVIPAGISSGGWKATTAARTEVAANESPTTFRGPIRSERMPPNGRATTTAMAKPAVRVPAAVRSKA